MDGNGDISLNDRILQYLESVGGFDTYDFAQNIKEDHAKIVGAVKSLLAYDELVTTDNRSRTLWALTPEGNEFVNEGSKEMRVFKLVPSEGMPIAQVMSQGTKIGFNKAVANGWLRVEKGIVKPSNAPTEDTVQIHLDHIFKNCSEKVSQADKETYKKRKLIEQVIVNSLYVDKGEKFTVELQKVENDLTAEMIATGAWKDLTFKPYNYNSMGTLPEGGHLHPLLKVRAQIRQIFLEMGFTEMPTNNYVESSFWNFDALFQPQQHPAREAHDTFFLSEPALSSQFPRDYLEQVKRVHSRGGFGSQGYGYEWQEEEAQKNLLRTHTTAVSARMLYKLAREGFRPAKYFSIDRVFRNEELDATHLAEFQQVEGVIADHNLTLGNLIGVLSEFFKKMGMDQLRFKPAYNPYTEPSMEIFSYHNGLRKWIEVGNSGVFRPEMLLPMGLPEDVNVIAWGLSLERPTMIKYGIDNIRDLVGPRVDLQMVYDNPICRLDKIVNQMSISA